MNETTKQIENIIKLDNLLCVHCENESAGIEFCKEIIIQLIKKLPNIDDKVLVINNHEINYYKSTLKNRFLFNNELDEEMINRRIIVEDSRYLGGNNIDYYKLLRFIITNNIKEISNTLCSDHLFGPLATPPETNIGRFFGPLVGPLFRPLLGPLGKYCRFWHGWLKYVEVGMDYPAAPSGPHSL